PLEAGPLLRRAHGGPLPTGPAAGGDLLRAWSGGDARRRRVRARTRGLPVPDAPRPHGPADEGPGPQARHGAVLEQDRWIPAGSRRQQSYRRLVRPPDVRRDVPPPDRVS